MITLSYIGVPTPPLERHYSPFSPSKHMPLPEMFLGQRPSSKEVLMAEPVLLHRNSLHLQGRYSKSCPEAGRWAESGLATGRGGRRGLARKSAPNREGKKGKAAGKNRKLMN